MNDAIHQLAEEKNLGWLDVNELFDDENGNLKQISPRTGRMYLESIMQTGQTGFYRNCSNRI